MSAGTNGGAGGDEESFLGRWSRRKRHEETPEEGRAEAPAIPRGEPDGIRHDPLDGVAPAEAEATSREDSGETSGGGVEATAPGVTAAPDAMPGETGRDPADTAEANEPPLLTDADMPALETLSADSDLSPFFNRGVTAALRRAALRHVFHQPRYNVRDGLNDYDGDYTVFEPLGDTVTSDMKFHAARRERERLEREAAERELAGRDADAAEHGRGDPETARSEEAGTDAAQGETEREAALEREADGRDADGEEAADKEAAGEEATGEAVAGTEVAGTGIVERRAGGDVKRSEAMDRSAEAAHEGDAGRKDAARPGDEAAEGESVEGERAEADGRTRRSEDGERSSARRERGATRG